MRARPDAAPATVAPALARLIRRRRDGRAVQGAGACAPGDSPPPPAFGGSMSRDARHRAHASNLAVLAGVRHAFFTRAGGVSQGIYASLNGGLGLATTTPQRVRENRAPRPPALGAAPAASSPSTRCTAPTVVVARAPEPGDRPRADGMVTRRRASRSACYRRLRAGAVRRPPRPAWSAPPMPAGAARSRASSRRPSRPWRQLGARPAISTPRSALHRPALLRGRAGSAAAGACRRPRERRVVRTRPRLRPPPVRPRGLRAPSPGARRDRASPRARRRHLRRRGPLLQRETHPQGGQRALRPPAVGDRARWVTARRRNRACRTAPREAPLGLSASGREVRHGQRSSASPPPAARARDRAAGTQHHPGLARNHGEPREQSPRSPAAPSSDAPRSGRSRPTSAPTGTLSRASAPASRCRR